MTVTTLHVVDLEVPRLEDAMNGRYKSVGEEPQQVLAAALNKLEAAERHRDTLTDNARLDACQVVRDARDAALRAVDEALLAHVYASGDTYPAMCLASEKALKAETAARTPGLTEAEGFRRLHVWQIAQSDYAEIWRRYMAKHAKRAKRSRVKPTLAQRQKSWADRIEIELESDANE